MLIPAVLRPSRCKLDCSLKLHFYYIEFIPVPADRRYQMFGLFVINRLPEESEKLDVELHLAHARIVKAGIKYLGKIEFNKEEALSCLSVQMLRHNFQGTLIDMSLFFYLTDDTCTQFSRNVFESSPGQIRIHFILYFVGE